MLLISEPQTGPDTRSTSKRRESKPVFCVGTALRLHSASGVSDSQVNLRSVGSGLIRLPW